MFMIRLHTRLNISVPEGSLVNAFKLKTVHKICAAVTLLFCILLKMSS
jgi:hypothetical protein